MALKTAITVCKGVMKLVMEWKHALFFLSRSFLSVLCFKDLIVSKVSELGVPIWPRMGYRLTCKSRLAIFSKRWLSYRLIFLSGIKKLEGWLIELKDEFWGELKVKLQGLFEQYLGRLIASSSVGQSPDKGKKVLGGPPTWIPSKGTFTSFSQSGPGHLAVFSPFKDYGDKLSSLQVGVSLFLMGLTFEDGGPS